MLVKSDLAVGDLSVLRVFPFPIISYFYSMLLKDNYRKSTQITTRKKKSHIDHVMQLHLKGTINTCVPYTVNL